MNLAPAPAPAPCSFAATGVPDVWAKVCPNKPTYAVGEAITFDFQVENRGSAERTLRLVGYCGAQYGLTVSQGGSVFSYPGERGMCPPHEEDLKLVRGKPFQAKVAWDQRIFHGASDTGRRPEGQVGTGPFSVAAWLTTAQREVKAEGRFAIGQAARRGPGCPRKAGAAPLRFSLAARCVAGDGSWDVAAADFDRDGKLDAAVANLTSADVAVFMGKGQGTFRPRASAASLGAEVDALVAADFDGDGAVDLAVGAEGRSGDKKGGLFLLRGRKDGTFAAPVSVQGSRSVRAVARGDFDADGILDLASMGDSVSVWRGVRTPQAFAAPGGPYEAGPAPHGIVAADFDADGKQDLAVAAQNGGLRVLWGKGDATFAAGSKDLSPGLNGGSVGSADFDCDGLPDLVATSLSGPFAVLLSTRPRGFQVSAAQPIGSGAAHVAIGDLDSDGRLDLAFPTAGGVAIFLGEGDGTFRFGTKVELGKDQESLAAGDFDGDGKLDLAVVSRSGTFSLLLNTSGAGEPPARAPDECGAPPRAVAGPMEVLASGQDDPFAVALDATTVYWANFGKETGNGAVMKRSLAGGAPATLASGQQGAGSLLLTDRDVYWANYRGGQIMRVAKAGGPASLVADSRGSPTSLALGHKHLYWVNWSGRVGPEAPLLGLLRAPLSGGSPEPFHPELRCQQVVVRGASAFVLGADVSEVSLADSRQAAKGPPARGFASGAKAYFGGTVDDANVYWTSIEGAAGSVLAAPRRGGPVVTLASGPWRPAAIASDGQNLYWSTASEVRGTIMKMPVAGGAPATLAQGLAGPTGLALDGDYLYWVNRGSGEVVRMRK